MPLIYEVGGDIEEVLDEIGGLPVFNTGMGDRILVLLYRAGMEEGIEVAHLMASLQEPHKGNLMKSVATQTKRHVAFVGDTGSRVHITSAGLAEVEQRRLLDPKAV